MRTIHIISHPREQLEVKECRQRRANGVEMSRRGLPSHTPERQKDRPLVPGRAAAAAQDSHS